MIIILVSIIFFIVVSKGIDSISLNDKRVDKRVVNLDR